MNAYTLEQKIDICLRYIASNKVTDIAAIRREALEALHADVVTNVDIDDLIADLLKELGMPPHMLGYECTAHALHLILEDHSYLEAINDKLYPAVAMHIYSERNYAANCRIERNIRRAIEAFFDRGDPDCIDEMFGGTVDSRKGKLTNRAFLAFCEKELRRRMKRNGMVRV